MTVTRLDCRAKSIALGKLPLHESTSTACELFQEILRAQHFRKMPAGRPLETRDTDGLNITRNMKQSDRLYRTCVSRSRRSTRNDSGGRSNGRTKWGNVAKDDGVSSHDRMFAQTDPAENTGPRADIDMAF